MAAIYSNPINPLNRIPVQKEISGPIEFLSIFPFPSLDRLWTVLADTRRVRRNLQSDSASVNLGIKDVPGMIVALKRYEQRVMGILQTHRQTV